MDKTLIHDEVAETPSEQQSPAPERTSSVRNDSECAFWVPSNLDSDEAEQVNEKEDDSSQVEERSNHDVPEEKSRCSLSSKKGRKRKRPAQALATGKKQKLVINKIIMDNEN